MYPWRRKMYEICAMRDVIKLMIDITILKNMVFYVL